MLSTTLRRIILIRGRIVRVHDRPVVLLRPPACASGRNNRWCRIAKCCFSVEWVGRNLAGIARRRRRRGHRVVLLVRQGHLLEEGVLRLSITMTWMGAGQRRRGGTSHRRWRRTVLSGEWRSSWDNRRNFRRRMFALERKLLDRKSVV